ncbi:hypothetical protein [Sphingomonas sp. UYP23]
MTSATIIPIQIAANRRKAVAVPYGWKPIFNRLLDQLSTLHPVPIIMNVEQRYGQLRIQLDQACAVAEMVAQDAVTTAAGTCDLCGGDGGTVCRTPDAKWARRCGMHFDLTCRSLHVRHRSSD